jgi:hypothetical protein
MDEGLTQPYRLGQTNRVEFISDLLAKVRNMCRTDSKKWGVDLTAANYAVIPNPLIVGEDRKVAYAASSKQNSLIAEENDRNKAKEHLVKLQAKAIETGNVVVAATQAPSKRVKWNGHTATPLACWMNRMGWSVDDALKVLPQLGFKVAESTIRLAVKYGVKGIKPAPVSNNQAEQLENMRKV